MKPFLIRALCILLLSGLTNCGGSSDPVVEIALHPTKPHILYVATNDYIYKSRDTGKTWENMSRGMSHSRVISFAIDPLFPANIYAGTKGDSVFKSFDGGQRWASRRTGMANITITSVVHQLIFSPGSSDHLFAATSMGVYETTNAGEHWIKRMDGMKEVLMVISIAVDPTQPQTAYAGTSGGVYKSVDGTKTWKKINNGLVAPEVLKSSRALGVTKVKVDPHYHETVYTATLTGLYKTTNGGEIWEKVGKTLPDPMLSDLVVDTSTPHQLYVGSRAGIHKSSDGGTTWEAKNTGFASLNIRALAMSHLDSNILYAGTNKDGLYQTVNGGETWTQIPLTLRPQNAPT
jgi:photosystem II stability/assembly factor-like uncharacterized protein